MATRQLPYDGDAIDVDATDATKIVNDTAAEEERIEAEFSSGGDAVRWKIVVNKIDPHSKDWEHCFNCTPEDFPIADKLRDLHGAGVYKALVYRNGKIHRNLTYRIAARVKSELPQPSQLQDLGSLLAKQTEMIANLARGAPTQAPPVDPMAMFTGMMTALAQAKEFFSAPQAQQTPLKDVLEIIAVARELSGDGGRDSNMADVIKELIKSPLTGEIAETLRDERKKQATLPQSTTQPQMLTARPVPLPQPPAAPAVPAVLQAMDQATIAQMKGQIDFWVAKARKGSDPSLYAELTLDNYAPEIIEAVILRDDIFEIMAALNAETLALRPWFEALLGEIRFLLTDAGEMGEEQVFGEFDGDFPLAAGDDQPGIDASVSVEPMSGTSAAKRSNGDTQRGGGRKGDAPDNVGTGQGGKEKSHHPTNSRKTNKRSSVKELDR